MMPLWAVIVGFVFVSFLQDSFEADFTSIRDLKAASDSLERRAICESLCRSERPDTTHFEKEISMGMCIHTCVRNKREGFIREGHKGRSQRSAYQQEDNDCLKPQDFVEYPGRIPSSITVDYSARKPNLSISWSPVHYNKNWTRYALHYSSMGEAVNIDRMNCKLIPKDQHEWILQNGSGWNYPDGIWVGIITYPHRKYDSFDMKRFGTTPRPPPTFPPTSSDVSTKLIAAILGAAFGFLLLVFAVLFYRKQINLLRPFRTCFPVEPNNRPGIAEPEKKSGPEIYYACYYPESPSYQLEVANVVNCFRENGYKVEMDVMNANERLDLGPTRWAEQQIKNALNVLVFLSPELLRLCASDLEGVQFSHQEHEIRWVELDLIRREYTQTRSLRKMVCIILPNTRVDPKDLPPWAQITYKWPEDKMNIFKRLNGRPIIQPS
ncbi:uncharacterized protein LOC110044579 isoform X2 [Orbicella faveolata]|uniref:uncharacterized protein LOC110044579 isoform X2 n=1 Tax=Orbicella faveolata TaxID=48498 RepID=UPI0009E3D443|nr:uncharacterized protein LOC110044579 isoform X2 [Orbicella faveolata]